MLWAILSVLRHRRLQDFHHWIRDFFTNYWRELLVLEVVVVFLSGVVTPFDIVTVEAFIVQ